MEYSYGAYPGAINIPLDDLPERALEFTDKNQEMILYCASGARSAYGQRILKQMGFTKVKNGGGLSDIMSRR
ncbi:MAG: rhodanese-like domain-containing protein [Spirochaetes bacterium]|nr:rhodanese-like domain-containing protein [Spirochaetota bacterium]MBU0957066.1 rhodanese-like domain-containing protein [Spirochaetota bacterium]